MNGSKVAVTAAVVAGKAVCPGEAHSNPYIDYCALCAPGWGLIAVHKVLTLADVKAELAKGKVVPVGLTDAADHAHYKVEPCEEKAGKKLVRDFMVVTGVV